MSFLNIILPSDKTTMVTQLPVAEIQNRLNWFHATLARGGPLNGVMVNAGWNGNNFYFATFDSGIGKASNQYAIVVNDNQLILYSRWKKGFRNALLILMGCALIGFTIEMIQKPLEREQNLLGLFGFPIIYGILLLITKLQMKNVEGYIKNMLSAR